MMPLITLEMLEDRLERLSNLVDKLEETLDRHDLWHPSNGQAEGDEIVAAVTEIKDELKDLHDMVYESKLD